MESVVVKYEQPLLMVIVNMTPDELLEKVKNDFDITVGRSTLRNYVNNKLIPEPQQKVLGRGLGSEATYPPGSEVDVATANYLLRFHKAEEIAESRAAYKRIEEKKQLMEYIQFQTKFLELLTEKKFDELYVYKEQLQDLDYSKSRLWYGGMCFMKSHRDFLQFERYEHLKQ